MPSGLFFFPKIAVPMSVILVPYEFGDYLFYFCGKCPEYFDRNCIKSVDCFG